VVTVRGPEVQFRVVHRLVQREFCDDTPDVVPSQSARIVNFGCDISHIRNSISDAAFRDITNVDVSEMCIEFMRRSDTRSMKWTVTGLTLTFPFESESFNFVLDKGTLDTVETLIN
jgi:hypothetical protein